MFEINVTYYVSTYKKMHFFNEITYKCEISWLLETKPTT